MAYNESVAARVYNVLNAQAEIVEKKMFGGVGYMVQGNMACGVNGEDLIIRVGPDAYEAALNQPHTRPFDMTGRPMRGWIVVEPAGYALADDMRAWVEQGLDFARSLPPK